MFNLFIRNLKQKWILLKIKRDIKNETIAIAKAKGIKKKDPLYQRLKEDVIDGKPQILGERYVIKE